jgi:hypothetical protein
MLQRFGSLYGGLKKNPSCMLVNSAYENVRYTSDSFCALYVLHFLLFWRSSSTVTHKDIATQHTFRCVHERKKHVVLKNWPIMDFDKLCC